MVDKNRESILDLGKRKRKLKGNPKFLIFRNPHTGVSQIPPPPKKRQTNKEEIDFLHFPVDPAQKGEQHPNRKSQFVRWPPTRSFHLWNTGRVKDTQKHSPLASCGARSVGKEDAPEKW